MVFDKQFARRDAGGFPQEHSRIICVMKNIHEHYRVERTIGIGKATAIE
jgi:hypothetical protein